MAHPQSDVDEAITIVLADDHQVVRGALKALLEGQADFDVVGEASSIESARSEVKASGPGVLILDVNMPDGLAVDAVAGLRQDAPGDGDRPPDDGARPPLARRAIDAGARGYLFKDAAHLELIEAVRCAAEGREYLSPAVTVGLKSDTARTSSPRSPRARPRFCG